MNKLGYFSIPIFILMIAISPSLHKTAFGHTFSGDESASFLTKIELIKIESQLAQDQVSKNVTLAREHAQNAIAQLTVNDTKEISERNARLAGELNSTLSDFTKAFASESPSVSDVTDKATTMSDLLAEVVSARIEPNQIKNVTVKALVLNDLLGKTLERYSSALGEDDGKQQDKHGENSTVHLSSGSSNESSTIVDNVDYQTAQATALRVLELFNEIKSDSNSNSTELGDSLNAIKEKIDNKVPLDEIDAIIDERITPMLNTVFKLNLVEDDQ